MKATHSTALNDFDFDYAIVGSGFGGSVSALRLAEKGYKVVVIEQGKRFRSEDFPTTNWNLRKYLWMPALRLFGFQVMSLFKDVLVLHGAGVGGGSLVYANTLLEPGDAFYQNGSWQGMADWKKELAPHYEMARKMLGVTQNRYLSPADDALRAVARDLGREDTFYLVQAGVLFGKAGHEGETIPDPFFGGKGPARSTCRYCGGCMVGCRYNAKNTLDKNYLYLAEGLGAEVRPESKVEDITALDGGGYALRVTRSTALLPSKGTVLRARGVVVAAGVLGTLKLLLHCRDVARTLPLLSPRLGADVRTNSESLIGMTTRDRTKDLSKGIAIDAGFYPEPNTHIETVRYPAGSSFMRLLAMPMADAGTWITRPLKSLASFFIHPIDGLRQIFNFRWAQSTVILLVMQTVDNRLRVFLKRSWYSLFRLHLSTRREEGVAAVPTFIPIANQVARLLAAKMNGMPQSSINEVLLQTPTTAHILGGCPIGMTRDSGVIDADQQAFGYPGLYICDGSAIPANLGVNPSLTITAMTERAMSRIPARR